MKVIIIAAVAENGVIGRDGKLPWRLPEDLKRFKKLTIGHAVVMGRKTWESLGGKPLPGRRNYVLTRREGLPVPAGASRAASLEAALAACRTSGEKAAFIIGGASVYKTALALANEMFLTHVHQDAEGDTRFPHWSPSDWEAVSREPSMGFDFVHYLRKGRAP